MSFLRMKLTRLRFALMLGWMMMAGPLTQAFMDAWTQKNPWRLFGALMYAYAFYRLYREDLAVSKEARRQERRNKGPALGK